jgi:hypothetical protein
MLLHRDLKPENLGIASDGSLKVSFFFASLRSPSHLSFHLSLSPLSTPRSLSLTPLTSLSLTHLQVFDFGLCRLVRKRTHATEAFAMTGTTGSLRYMAPEVCLGQPYTEKVGTGHRAHTSM